MTDTTNNNARWVFTGIQKLELQHNTFDTSSCGPYEAIIEPKRTGLCGSDVHIFQKGLIRGKPFKKPFVLGHETSGIVLKVGENVAKLKAGDRVALEPGEACLRCSVCKTGHYAHCESMKFAAALGRDGTLQSYYRLPADLCYKLPENMSMDDGALIEPLSVAIQAVYHVACMRPLSNVVVFGAGPVGLLTMAVVKTLGAKMVLAIDVNEERLKFAKDYAATEIHVASPMDKDEERAAYSQRHSDIIREKFGIDDLGSSAIDLIMECSGAEPCIQTGLHLLKRRGTFVQVGNGGVMASVPMLAITNRELTVKGSFRYGPGCYEMAIDLVSRGVIDLKPLVTHSYSWENAQKAFEANAKAMGDDGKMAIKIMISGPK